MQVAKPSSKGKLISYGGFAGLDSSRSDFALESPERQSFVDMDNAYVDWAGTVSNERGLFRLPGETRRISHVRFFSAVNDAFDIIYATREDGYTSLKSLAQGRSVTGAFPKDAVVTSVMSNGEAVVCGGSKPFTYSAGTWRQVSSNDAAGATLCASVAGRLILAGFSNAPTVIRASRYGNNQILQSDEPLDSVSVIKAGGIDISPVIDRAERITALAPFEGNRLVIFTGDRALVYKLDPDISKWTIDEGAQIRVGCISHNAVASWNNEIIFPSRYGVHSFRRTLQGGSSITTIPMSQKIQRIYRKLISQVRRLDDISAVLDADTGRYHLIIPVSDSVSHRLSFSISPLPTETGAIGGAWSLSSHAGVTCGDYLSGVVIFGTRGGIYRMAEEFEEGGVRGKASFTMPILWHGSTTDPKSSGSMVLIADGAGVVEVFASDEAGRELSVVRFELPAKDQADYSGQPGGRNFIRPFQHQYVGVRFRVLITSENEVRIYALGVKLKEQ